jgi:hypothetical protein
MSALSKHEETGDGHNKRSLNNTDKFSKFSSQCNIATRLTKMIHAAPKILIGQVSWASTIFSLLLRMLSRARQSAT